MLAGATVPAPSALHVSLRAAACTTLESEGVICVCHQGALSLPNGC